MRELVVVVAVDASADAANINNDTFTRAMTMTTILLLHNVSNDTGQLANQAFAACGRFVDSVYGRAIAYGAIC